MTLLLRCPLVSAISAPHAHDAILFFILQRASLICTGATAWAQPPSAEAIVLFSSSLVVDS